MIWNLPQSFCPSTVYELSSDGELTGLIPQTGPLCIFAYPFSARYQLSAFLEQSPLSVEFFVDNFNLPFSSCESGIRCSFWHTRPFLLRISGGQEIHGSLRLTFEGGSFGHTNNPCYLGLIPVGGTPAVQSAAAEFKCQDLQEFQHNEVVFVVGLSLICLTLVGFLHFTGIINLMVILRGERESFRFETMREELPRTKGLDAFPEV
jgi:hypothetical protein